MPGSTQVKNGGLYLLISRVTAAHEGEYTCLVKGHATEILRTYRVRVDGENHFKNKAILLNINFPPSTLWHLVLAIWLLCSINRLHSQGVRRKNHLPSLPVTNIHPNQRQCRVVQRYRQWHPDTAEFCWWLNKNQHSCGSALPRWPRSDCHYSRPCHGRRGNL